MLLDALLKGLKGKKRRELSKSGNTRIGTVQSFLRRMVSAMGPEETAAALKVKPGALQRAIKHTGGTFTYFDNDHATPAAWWALVEKQVKKGEHNKPLSKTDDQPSDDASKFSEGSILDFECVITTGRRDRDGDVLDPKGAIIDPKMPLLWQHIPFQPIGRMLKLLDQSDEKITARFMVCNTELGRDAALLIQAGCLRISHGFAPVDYNPLKNDDGKEMGGWHISKYAMMETSTVSIPSNIDAEITNWQNGKLHHPLVKSWCKTLFDNRKKFVTGGYDPDAGANVDTKHVCVTIHLKGLPGGTATTKVKGEKVKKDDADTGSGADEDDEGKGKKGSVTIHCNACGKDSTVDPNAYGRNQDIDCPKCGSTDVSTPKDEDTEEKDEEEDDEEDKDEDPETGEETGDAEDEDEEEGGEKEVRALGEIIDSVKELAKDNTIPKEAQRRLQVVSGMFEDVEDGIGKAADELAGHSKNRDLVKMFGCMADVTSHCTQYIGRAVEELERVKSVADLPESHGKSSDDIVSDGKGIMDAVKAMTGAGDEDGMETEDFDSDEDEDEEMDDAEDEDADADDGAEEDEDDEDKDREDADDVQDDEEDEEEAMKDDEADDEKEEEDSEEKDDDTEDEKEDDDTEEKEEDEAEEKDDDSEEEKEAGDDDDDEEYGEPNTNAKPVGGENPGVDAQDAKPKGSRRRLSKLLGRELMGQNLSPAERLELRKYKKARGLT